MCLNRAYNLIKQLCGFSSRLIESIIWERESESENERECKGFCWRQVFPGCGSWVCGGAGRLRDHKKMIRFVFHCSLITLSTRNWLFTEAYKLRRHHIRRILYVVLCCQFLLLFLIGFKQKEWAVTMLIWSKLTSQTRICLIGSISFQGCLLRLYL